MSSGGVYQHVPAPFCLVGVSASGLLKRTKMWEPTGLDSIRIKGKTEVGRDEDGRSREFVSLAMPMSPLLFSAGLVHLPQQAERHLNLSSRRP